MKHTTNQRGGIYSLSEVVELKAKLSTLTIRIEELEIRNQQEVRVVTELTVPLKPCFTCQSTSHQGENYGISPSVRDLMVENANVVGQNRTVADAQYGNTYNPNWKNHPTSFGSLNLQHMFPQVHNSSHQPHHLLRKLS